MKRIIPPKPVSAGIILSYRCTGECRHCMYACSPKWSGDWISENDLYRILSQLPDKILPSPLGRDRVGINYGLHFTGGEPFLNFDLLVKGVKMAKNLGIPSIFVETNSFWCIDDESTRRRLETLRDAGLDGILVSVNPFLVEHVPFERIVRDVEISRQIFGENLMVYQELFYHLFKRMNLRGRLSFEEYLRMGGARWLGFAELIPMGRACYRLRNLFHKYPAKRFLKERCKDSLLRDWHVHIDNYGNYMTGYCGGISLGNARNLDQLIEDGVDLDDRPILRALMKNLGELYDFAVKEFGYRERSDGYISKCDLCLNIRRYIVQQTDEFKELSPREFYEHLL